MSDFPYHWAVHARLYVYWYNSGNWDMDDKCVLIAFEAWSTGEDFIPGSAIMIKSLYRGD